MCSKILVCSLYRAFYLLSVYIWRDFLNICVGVDPSLFDTNEQLTTGTGKDRMKSVQYQLHPHCRLAPTTDMPSRAIVQQTIGMSDLQGPSRNWLYLSFGMSYARGTSCVR